MMMPVSEGETEDADPKDRFAKWMGTRGRITVGMRGVGEGAQRPRAIGGLKVLAIDPADADSIYRYRLRDY